MVSRRTTALDDSKAHPYPSLYRSLFHSIYWSVNAEAELSMREVLTQTKFQVCGVNIACTSSTALSFQKRLQFPVEENVRLHMRSM